MVATTEIIEPTFSSTGLPDDATLEADLMESRYAAFQCDAQAADANRCWDCNDITSGTVIAGQHCQICDACLAAYVVHQLGKTLVSNVLAIA